MSEFSEVKLLRDEFVKCYDELMRQREILDKLHDDVNEIKRRLKMK